MVSGKFSTVGQISRLQAKVLGENDVFKIGKRGVARIFLRELLGLKPNASESDIELAYKACKPQEEMPDSSDDFWIYVEKEYLYLEAEPKTKFVELSFRVTEDLAVLAGYLKYIRKELATLEDKKKAEGRLAPDERYYRNQLEYFENKNVTARDEIVDFMTHSIKKHAVKLATVQHSQFPAFGKFLFGEIPYAFGRRMAWIDADPYDVRSLDQYANKFMDLPVSSHKTIVDECRVNPAKFKQFAAEYINGVPGHLPSVRVKIEKLVEKSHILFNRKQIIATMLQHFEDKDYISFVSMAPLQIEGIFADVCREIGISENQLDISSLNDKLQHIDQRMRSFFFFEYYSFKFPVLRNLVAHGGLVDGELEDTAIHLVLDLLPVCELAASEDLPIMHTLNVLAKASCGNHQELVEWLDLRKSVEIPDFYNATESMAKAEANYSLPDFWNHLESELKKLRDVDQVKTSEPVKIAGKLKSSGIAVEQAEKFLKSSGRVAREAIEKRNEILEKVKNTLKLSGEELNQED